MYFLRKAFIEVDDPNDGKEGYAEGKGRQTWKLLIKQGLTSWSHKERVHSPRSRLISHTQGNQGKTQEDEESNWLGTRHHSNDIIDPLLF